ncbi:MAG: minE [Cyanobacteria bacterium RYN_339]|nr:minE [Cyanobacteria bacterium RYN_339]
MGIATLIDRIFGRTPEASKETAKDRLRLVLMHDRSDIPATMMDAIRAELVQVLGKYVEIDQEAMDVQLEKDAGAIGLVLNIPIKRVKTEAEASEALAAMQALQEGKDQAKEKAKDQAKESAEKVEKAATASADG